MSTPAPSPLACSLEEAFRLEPAGPGRFLASSLGDPKAHNVVFGGQILAQTVLASGLASTSGDGGDGKEVASVHTVFSRAASLTRVLEIEVEVAHTGRTAATHSVSVRQGDRECARAVVLRLAPTGDLIRHHPPMPDVPGPDECGPLEARGLVAPGTEARVAEGPDTWDPGAPAGPARLEMWVRLPSPAASSLFSQALLAYATDGFLIGAAMRPHPGVGQAMAHREISTGVLAHTVGFHEPVPVGEWLLMVQEACYAGRGRAFGRGLVFGRDGTLVASFSQESIIREVMGNGRL